MDCFYHYDSPLGGMTMSSDGEALTGLWFDGQKGFPGREYVGCAEERLPVFGETVRWLDIYFGGRDPGFRPALNLRATPFRRTVWEILMTVPYGRTVTYGEIAERILRRTGAARMSAQAVGGAVGHNPAALIIPCHRVVGSDGSLTGYAGGIERKAALLRMEGAGARGTRENRRTGGK